MKKQPKVNEVNEFLEIASDFEDPLEVIRESLSNSYDANASEVTITIKSRETGSDIIIEDDGNGMNQRDLESFFDLGNSRKTDSIGYKGHGTKIFYKSDRIVVNTASDETNFRAVMERPWEKLNRRELPEYEVSETPVRSGNPGTSIRIRNFRSGQGFDPESLTYNKIHHYLKWKTIAGSTEHFFTDDFHDMTITVKLGEKIDDTREKLVTTNRFEFPDPQPEPDDSKYPASRMCKIYPPRELDVEYEGGSTEIQIVGMVGGKDARNELPTYGKHSAQFGIWFAKDHIKVERLNEAISHDNEFIHFMFVVNCQDIELSANRENIRNKSSEVYQAVEEEVEYYLSKVTQDPWFKDYLRTRKEAQIRRRAQNRRSSLKNRREAVETRDAFEPSNRAEVILGLEKTRQSDESPPLTVEDFDPSSEIHSIIRQSGKLRNAAVHCELTDHFKEELPMDNIDLIICWDYGDLSALRELERNGYLGGKIDLQLEEEAIYYGDEDRKYIEIFQLNDERGAELEPMLADD